MESKKKKRMFIQVGDVRIAPDIISAYAPINSTANLTGVQIIFPNGRYLEIKTTEQKKKRVIAMLDKPKRADNQLMSKYAPDLLPELCRIMTYCGNG